LNHEKFCSTKESEYDYHEIAGRKPWQDVHYKSQKVKLITRQAEHTKALVSGLFAEGLWIKQSEKVD
jgi:hypothetical protein